MKALKLTAITLAAAAALSVSAYDLIVLSAPGQESQSYRADKVSSVHYAASGPGVEVLMKDGSTGLMNTTENVTITFEQCDKILTVTYADGEATVGIFRK